MKFPKERKQRCVLKVEPYLCQSSNDSSRKLSLTRTAIGCGKDSSTRVARSFRNGNYKRVGLLTDFSAARVAQESTRSQFRTIGLSFPLVWNTRASPRSINSPEREKT